MKKALAKKAVAAIKKTKITSNSSKPWVEVHEGMSLEQAKILIGECGEVKKDTKSLFVVNLTSGLFDFLPTLPPVNQAHFTGKMWSFGGGPVIENPP